MKYIFKKPAVLIVVLALFTACDVFDAEPQRSIIPSDAFTSSAAVSGAVSGIYDILQNEDYYGAYFQYTADNYVDVGDFQGFFQGFQAPDQGAIPARNDNIFSIWAQAYEAINLTNEILDKVPDLDFPDLDEDGKTAILAEARGLRGLVYLDLLTHFAEHYDLSSQFGLPLVSQSNNSSLLEIQNPVRASVAETYAFIEADLQFAIDNLPGDGSNTRMNAAAAQGILARALLHKGDYAGAIAAATDVIDNSGYRLLDSVEDIYAIDASDESLFELPFTTLDPSSLATFTISRDEVRPEPSLIASFEDMDQRRRLIDFVPGFNGERFVKAEDLANQANPAYIMRLAEVYLIRAEAAFLDDDSTNDDQALADLNATRTRAGLSALTTTDDFVDRLLDEYLWEFFAEGHRFRSLVRLGKAQEVVGLADFRRIYPIPQQELDVDGNQLTQNPGY